MKFNYSWALIIAGSLFLSACPQVREKISNVRIGQVESISNDITDRSIVYVALNEKGNNLYAYDMRDHKQTFLLKDFPEMSDRSSFQILPEKKIGLVVSNESQIKVFSISNEKVIFNKTFSKRVGNALLSPDGNWIAFFKRPEDSNKASDELTIINLTTGEVRIAQAIHQKECTDLFWSADSSKIITATSVPESQGKLTDWTITETQTLKRSTQQAEPFLYTNNRNRSLITKRGKGCWNATRYSFKPGDEKAYQEATGIEVFKDDIWKSVMHFETGPEVSSVYREASVGQASPTCEVVFYPMAKEIFVIDMKTRKFVKLFDKSKKPELIEIDQPF